MRERKSERQKKREKGKQKKSERKTGANTALLNSPGVTVRFGGVRVSK